MEHTDVLDARINSSQKSKKRKAAFEEAALVRASKTMAKFKELTEGSGEMERFDDTPTEQEFVVGLNASAKAAVHVNAVGTDGIAAAAAAALERAEARLKDLLKLKDDHDWSPSPVSEAVLDQVAKYASEVMVEADKAAAASNSALVKAARSYDEDM